VRLECGSATTSDNFVRHLRRILKISWSDYVSNEGVLLKMFESY